MDSPRLRQQESDQDDLAYGKEEAATILPTEKIAANNYDLKGNGQVWDKDIRPWSQSYDIPHSCRHCGRIKVVTDAKQISGTPVAIGICISQGIPFIRLCIADKIADLRKALDDKCLLFEFWFEEYRDMKDSELLELLDVDGSGTVQALFQKIDETEKDSKTEAYGYWDLSLLLQEGQYKTRANSPRAIIQPGKLPTFIMLRRDFQPFLQASSKYFANNYQMGQERP